MSNKIKEKEKGKKRNQIEFQKHRKSLHTVLPYVLDEGALLSSYKDHVIVGCYGGYLHRKRLDHLRIIKRLQLHDI